MRWRLGLCNPYANRRMRGKDPPVGAGGPDLLVELDGLARQGLVPESFSDQVAAGLRLLVRRAVPSRPARPPGSSAPTGNAPNRPTAGSTTATAAGERRAGLASPGRAALGRGPGRRGRAVRVAADDPARRRRRRSRRPTAGRGGGQRACPWHLLASIPHDQLGEAVGELCPDDVQALQTTVQRLVTA